MKNLNHVINQKNAIRFNAINCVEFLDHAYCSSNAYTVAEVDKVANCADLILTLGEKDTVMIKNDIANAIAKLIALEKQNIIVKGTLYTMTNGEIILAPDMFDCICVLDVPQCLPSEYRVCMKEGISYFVY